MKVREQHLWIWGCQKVTEIARITVMTAIVLSTGAHGSQEELTEPQVCSVPAPVPMLTATPGGHICHWWDLDWGAGGRIWEMQFPDLQPWLPWWRRW